MEKENMVFVGEGRHWLKSVASRIACELDPGEEWVISIEPVNNRPKCFVGIPWLSKHPLYTLWSAMWDRCTNKKHISYPDYGGRGVVICDEWRDFVRFLIDVGERPSKRHSLDRINRDGGYEPGNVRWATCAEQNNNKRSNRRIEWRGETKTMAQWAKTIGLSTDALSNRLNTKKWSIERALSQPLEKHAKRKPK